MGRTPEQIKESIFNACGGDWADSSQRISELQSKLIQALIWRECPPADGWDKTFSRQVRALRDVPEIAQGSEGFSLFNLPEETAVDIIKSIIDKYEARTPWDVEWVDEYIESHK